MHSSSLEPYTQSRSCGCLINFIGLLNEPSFALLNGFVTGKDDLYRFKPAYQSESQKKSVP